MVSRTAKKVAAQEASGDEGPAILVMDNGERIELPGMSCGQAHEIWRMACELGELIGGEVDPYRVRIIGVDD